jgi:pimeloyl-ACP methyl ester carboxylesterase
VALSVGHPAAYARGGLVQKLRGYYVLLIQLRHVIEFLVTRFDWWPLERLTAYPEEFANWKSRLSRPGRLTAGFNYYRANLHLFLGQEGERVKVPVVGAWSSGDRFLVEQQMTNSAQYCDAGWTYVRLDGPNHWLQLTSPDTVNSLLVQYLR